MIGQTLGKYHILEKLSAGGIMAVFKAVDLESEHYVVIKLLQNLEHNRESLIELGLYHDPKIQP